MKEIISCSVVALAGQDTKPSCNMGAIQIRWRHGVMAAGQCEVVQRADARWYEMVRGGASRCEVVRDGCKVVRVSASQCEVVRVNASQC